jgi:prefoldin subunit 5
MEIRIGIRENQRDLSFESGQSVAEITNLIDSAFAQKSDLLKFEDEKGKTILVPVASIAYVEIGAEQNRRVGFIA